jgi:hypothetical protein
MLGSLGGCGGAATMAMVADVTTGARRTARVTGIPPFAAPLDARPREVDVFA